MDEALLREKRGGRWEVFVEELKKGELYSNTHGGGHCITASFEGCVNDDDRPSQ